MAKALIVGAGAIGRGYLPWELKNFELTFFDTNTNLIDSLKESGGYKTFMSFGTHLENYYVNNANFENSIKNINLDNFDIAIVCVGPRNLKYLPIELGTIKCPMYSLENDSATVYELRHLLNKTNIYFGVPDVITSLTASPENLKEDINSLHTENGVLYLEDHGDIPEKLKDLMPEVEWVSKERMIKEWDAKLYIHNTPHCIAAFYGYLHDCEYVHDALAIDSVKLKLGGVVDEVLQTLKILTNHDHDFLEWYAEKEIARFSNKLLYDPVKRVARQPLRKLAPGGRLVGILKLALEAGVMPINLAYGIAASIKYTFEDDEDSIYTRNIDTIGIEAFLSYMVRVNPSSVEGKLIINAYKNFKL
jgi:hypothetical protein